MHSPGLAPASRPSQLSAPEPSLPAAGRRGIPGWVIALLLSALVIVPRTAMIANAHSESADDEYHLARGLAFLERYPLRWDRNDPPLGEALLALPMWLTGPAWRSDDAWDAPGLAMEAWLSPLAHHPWPRERLLFWTAVWKALLLLPLPVLVFTWCRRLYGSAAGWLALAVLLIEPTFAAHFGTVGLDVPGVTALLVACYTAWRYLQSPTRGRLVVAGVATAAAMLIKHTAVILPAVILAYALLAKATGEPARPGVRGRLNRWMAMMLIALAAVWPLTLFEVSPPADSGRELGAEYTDAWSLKADAINPLLKTPIPAGTYLGSVIAAYDHGLSGHLAFLHGEWRTHGWWYYFPVVATYKIPIGVAVVMLMAVVSLRWLPPRWDEWPLLIGVAAWATFIFASGINIGFRHFLPIYVFLIMLAARAAAAPAKWIAAVAWAGVVAAGVHAASFHPDYLSYINWPREHPHLAITDSNLDWGQSLKQVRRWLDDRPDLAPVYIRYFPDYTYDAAEYYLGDRARVLCDADPVPSEGLLIVSPYYLVAQAELQRLSRRPPIDVIGHAMRVYRLEAGDDAGDD